MSIRDETTQVPIATKDSSRRLKRTAVVIEAAVIAVLIWAAAVPLAGVDLRVTTGGTVQTIGPVQILVMALLAGAAAWVVLAVAEKVSRRPRRIWFPAAATAGVVSLAGPLFSGASMAAMLVLLGLHVAVGGILTVGLLAVAGPRQSSQ
ncbi:DUF6069 family protein [Arthrobacter castelli]|uniref:DUF6069 family protein n=1 Tax=Arthrobacter castelli TaxID=271431 RepID=UPI000415C4A2|nr:DUF6069 family protein [Arthrobacter castelli]